jgi:hypothetical protein
MPVAFNLLRYGVIIWFEASGVCFLHQDEGIRGLQLRRQINIRAELHGRFDKSVFPEAWIDRFIPPVRLGQHWDAPLHFNAEEDPRVLYTARIRIPITADHQSARHTENEQAELVGFLQTANDSINANASIGDLSTQLSGSFKEASGNPFQWASRSDWRKRLLRIFFGNEDKPYIIATIHGFALQNILPPFHHYYPNLARGTRSCRLMRKPILRKPRSCSAIVASEKSARKSSSRYSARLNGQPLRRRHYLMSSRSSGSRGLISMPT